MRTELGRRELAKGGIFVSVLMVLFGFGSCIATADLVPEPTAGQRVWAIAGFVVGIAGIPLLVVSVLQFRKARDPLNWPMWLQIPLLVLLIAGAAIEWIPSGYEVAFMVVAFGVMVAFYLRLKNSH